MLTVGEGIIKAEKIDQSEMSAGRAIRSLGRPPVTQLVTQALLLFMLLQGGPECDLKLMLFFYLQSLHRPLAICITNTASHTSGPLTVPTYTAPRNTTKPPDT